MRLSHRLRLTISSSAASALVLLVVFFGVYRFAEESENREAQSSLLPICELILSDISDNFPDLKEAKEADARVNVTVYFDGKLVEYTGIAMPNLPGAGIKDTSDGPYAYRTEGTSRWSFVVSTSYASEAASLRRLRLMLFILFLPILLLIGASTYIAARLTFKPLALLTEQAGHISGEDLGRRVAVQDDAEFGMLAEQLNGLLERVEIGATKQEQFVADAAHELRTPLTILQGNLETVLSRDRDSSEYVQTLEVSLKEVKRLASLTEALLESARAKVAEVAPLDLEATINKICARWLDRFVRQGVDLQVQSESAYARITESELVCVMDNLLDNALRFSPKDTVCSVALQRTQNETLITVSDQGPGIPREARSDVFERFFQVDPARSPEGFGIGLSICRRIIKARGGELALDDSDTGTTFRLTLPSGE